MPRSCHRLCVAILGVGASGCGRVGFETPGGDAPAVRDGAPVAIDASLAAAAHYPMDDDPAGGLLHAVPSAWDAPCAPCPTAVDGRVGSGAYAFDGTLRVALPEALHLDLEPFTVALWIRSNPTGSLMSAFSQPVSTTSFDNVVSFIIVNDDRIYLETAEAGSSIGIPVLGPDLGVGEWHHIAASWDGVTRRFYADGALVGAGDGAITPSALAPAIGGDLDAGVASIFFRGALDELYLFRRALDISEIAALAAP